jgi:hypothetical protein
MTLIIDVILIVLVFDITIGICKHVWKKLRNFNK